MCLSFAPRLCPAPSVFVCLPAPERPSTARNDFLPYATLTRPTLRPQVPEGGAALPFAHDSTPYCTVPCSAPSHLGPGATRQNSKCGYLRSTMVTASPFRRNLGSGLAFLVLTSLCCFSLIARSLLSWTNEPDTDAGPGSRGH